MGFIINIKAGLGMIPEDQLINTAELITKITTVKESIASRIEYIESIASLLETSEHKKDILKRLGMDELSDLHLFAKELVIGTENALQYASKILPRYLVKAEVTTKEAALVDYLVTLTKVSSMYSSVILSILYQMNNDKMYKAREKAIGVESSIFRGSIAQIRTKTHTYLKTIEEMDDNIKTSAGFEVAVKDSKLRLPTANFIGIVWSFRKFLIDLDYQRFEKLKIEHNLTTLRVAELKSGIRTTTTEKQVKYYEGKLASIDKEILEIEKG